MIYFLGKKVTIDHSFFFPPEQMLERPGQQGWGCWNVVVSFSANGLTSQPGDLFICGCVCVCPRGRETSVRGICEQIRSRAAAHLLNISFLFFFFL